MLAVLLACHGDADERSPADDSVPPDDSAGDSADDSGTPGVPIEWGVVESCGVTPGGGFDDFYGHGTAVLVYGPEEADFAAQVVEWYGKWVSFDLRAYADLTEADREQNLFVIGSPGSNGLFAELNGSVPVWFADDAFVFGGHRYDEHGSGIAYVHPSPFAEDKWVLVYGGNSFEGMYSTFTIWTGAYDYETTRGRGVLMHEGDFCREGKQWGWYADYGGADEWPTWQEWRDSLDETVTSRHIFRYEPGGIAASTVASSADTLDARFDEVLALLELEPLDAPIASYLYPNNGTKDAITGNAGNAHANDLNFETHMVVGDGVSAWGIHEDVHVIAWYRIGDTSYSLLGEGLAVAMDGEWWGESLSSWASELASEGTLPMLSELEDNDVFWSIGDATTYPVAGHFVAWLLDAYGADAVKALYVAPDLDAAFESELGMTHEEVEKAWLSSIP